MGPVQIAETTLRISFWIAHGMLSSYAEGAKAYWRAWGLMGEPAIQAVQMWEETQRQYLEALEEVLIPVSHPSMPQRDRTSPPRDLFSIFGLLGFEDT